MKKKDLPKTIEKWEKEEKAERKTFKGKIKYTWKDWVYYPLYRLFYKIREIPNEIKYFIQRGQRGYSDRDVWSIDWYLSEWMPKALHQMKKGISYPGVGSAKTHREWVKILEKMAKGFEASYKIREYDFKGEKQLKKLQKLQKRGLKLFIKWFDSLWD